MYEVKNTPGGGVSLVEDGLVVVSAPDLTTLAKRVAKLEDTARTEAQRKEGQAAEARAVWGDLGEALLLVENARDGMLGVDHGQG